jgi:branched-chain amino acid transport system permease protein
LPKILFFANNSSKPKIAVLALITLIMLLLPLLGVSQYYMQVLMGVFIYIVMTSSLRLVSLSGQISLGHAGFMCIGAYASAILAKDLGWTPWLSIPVAALLTFVVALLIAIPFSRLRGLYFTMISLFFGLAVLAVNQVLEHITGGQSGLSGIPKLFGASPEPYYYFFIGIMIICLCIMYRLEFSRIGLTWKAIAQSAAVASSTGIPETGQRILSFAIGGLFAGLVGAAYAHNIYIVLSVTTFSFFSSIFIFVYLMVGGINSFYGPILGTAVILLLQVFARSLKEYVPFIPAAILLIVLFLMPQGLVSMPAQLKRLFRKIHKNTEISPENEVNGHAS